MHNTHKDTRPLRDIAIERVRSFLKETGIPGYELGKRAHVGTKFVDRLERGELQRLASIEKVEQWMAEERARRLAERPAIIADLEAKAEGLRECDDTENLEELAHNLGFQDWYRGITQIPFVHEELKKAWIEGFSLHSKIHYLNEVYTAPVDDDETATLEQVEG